MNRGKLVALRADLREAEAVGLPLQKVIARLLDALIDGPDEAPPPPAKLVEIVPGFPERGYNLIPPPRPDGTAWCAGCGEWTPGKPGQQCGRCARFQLVGYHGEGRG